MPYSGCLCLRTLTNRSQRLAVKVKQELPLVPLVRDLYLMLQNELHEFKRDFSVCHFNHHLSCRRLYQAAPGTHHLTPKT